MANKQPTCQQLAYLDELKQRLQDLRLRQETFMEETAEILRNIGPLDRPVPTKALPSKASVKPARNVDGRECVDDRECVGSIKQLIQRFEDLRQTSRQFSDQAMPEELLGVDVRKLLKGYENLVVEGNILQNNWLLLKKTTESCARQGNNVEPKLKQPSSKSPSFAEQPYDVQLKVLPRATRSLKFSLESNTHKYTDKFNKNSNKQFEKPLESQPKFSPRITRRHSSKLIKFSIESTTQTYVEHVKKVQRDYDNENRQRFGALLQLLLRANPFRTCAKRSVSFTEESRKN
ncbi:hypothetical protein ACLKA7_003324 [Drosophila subpalustris]